MSKRWLGLLLLTVWFGASGVAHAAQPVITETPDPIDIGPVAVGSFGTADGMLSADVSAAVTLQLRSGGACAQFQITTPTSVTLDTTPIPVTVKFTPTSTGSKTCMLDVKQGGTLKTFGVAGTGTGTPQLSVDPTSLAFSVVEVGHTSATQRVTASNPGNATLTITSAGFTAGNSNYTVSGTTGSQTVVAGGSATWDIACRPQAQGAANGTFQIVSNAPVGGTVNVDLTCSGNNGVLATDQLTIDFGDVLLTGNRTRALTLSNTGNVAVTGITGVFDKPNVGYSIDPTTPVPTMLGPGGMATLTLKFAPVTPSDGGAAKLTFSGSWGAGNTTTAVVSLTGQTVSLNVTPASLDFLDFRFDSGPTQVFHIINRGSAPVAIDSATFVPDAPTLISEVIISKILLGPAVVSSFPATVPGNQQFDVTVKAVPNNRAGMVSGHFVVHSTTTGIPDQNVAITGNAITAGITATAMVDFGAVDMDVAATTPPKLTATITNTGAATLDVSAVTITNTSGTSGAFTFKNPLPTTPTSLAHNASLMFEVTYKPTVERGATDIPDKIVLGATLTGAVPGPAMQTITIQGHGIDRHLAVDAPTFPPTFRNPGDAAPIRAVTVHNNGDALLKITAVMISGQPVWQLVDGSPVDIPGRTSHDLMVKFSPSDFGPAPPGQLTVMSNDNQNLTKIVTLTGTVEKRDVAFGPDPDPTEMIDLGFTGVGIPVTADDVLAVTNRDPNVAFTIHAIQLSGDPGFRVEQAPADIALPATMAKRFSITFAPTAVGDFHATATLLLDQDPVSTADVQITGHAVFVDAHGSGGCDAGGTGRGSELVIGLAALGVLGRRRRRSAR